MNIDGSVYPYASRREVVYSRRGMVCTSQHLAAQAGLDMLKHGGNAVDAALATAICLTVLEPTSNGLGSDAFALIWMDGKLHGINGSGWSPAALTRERLVSEGIKKCRCALVSGHGARSSSHLAEVHRRFGKLPFNELFEPLFPTPGRAMSSCLTWRPCCL
mgnify:CR=1 FL=1